MEPLSASAPEIAGAVRGRMVLRGSGGLVGELLEQADGEQ